MTLRYCQSSCHHTRCCLSRKHQLNPHEVIEHSVLEGAMLFSIRTILDAVINPTIRSSVLLLAADCCFTSYLNGNFTFPWSFEMGLLAQKASLRTPEKELAPRVSNWEFEEDVGLPRWYFLDNFQMASGTEPFQPRGNVLKEKQACHPKGTDVNWNIAEIIL